MYLPEGFENTPFNKVLMFCIKVGTIQKILTCKCQYYQNFVEMLIHCVPNEFHNSKSSEPFDCSLHMNSRGHSITMWTR